MGFRFALIFLDITQLGHLALWLSNRPIGCTPAPDPACFAAFGRGKETVLSVKGMFLSGYHWRCHAGVPHRIEYRATFRGCCPALPTISRYFHRRGKTRNFMAFRAEPNPFTFVLLAPSQFPDVRGIPLHQDWIAQPPCRPEFVFAFRPSSNVSRPSSLLPPSCFPPPLSLPPLFASRVFSEGKRSGAEATGISLVNRGAVWNWRDQWDAVAYPFAYKFINEKLVVALCQLAEYIIYNAEHQQPDTRVSWKLFTRERPSLGNYQPYKK